MEIDLKENTKNKLIGLFNQQAVIQGRINEIVDIVLDCSEIDLKDKIIDISKDCSKIIISDKETKTE